MFSKPTRDQVIALAGMFQSCQLVETLSKNGTIPADHFNVCIESLFQKNPENTEAVYGSINQLQLGIETMQELITLNSRAKGSDTLRYIVGVVYLSKKLRQNKKMLNLIGDRLDQAYRQAEHFSVSHANVIANLAQIYQDSLSTFHYRIQVNGYASYLQQENIAQRIRCLLFSGIRSAILWHQLGGRRRHLVLNRKDILNLVRKL